jgi:putative transposase
MKQQFLVINRSRQRAPNLSALDRFLFGFWSLFLDPRRIQRAAVIIRPSTLLKFHDLLINRKYRLLYSSSRKGKPGPKGPSLELIQAIIELKQHNPRFGYLRIAQKINKHLAWILTRTWSGVSSLNTTAQYPMTTDRHG